MAIFRCDSCGHEQSVEAEHIGRTARCPECRHLSVVQDDPVDEVATASSSKLRYVALVALCGTIFTAQLLISRNGQKFPVALRDETLASPGPAGVTIGAAANGREHVAKPVSHLSVVTTKPNVVKKLAEVRVDPDVSRLRRKLVAIGPTAELEEPVVHAALEQASSDTLAAPVAHSPESPLQRTTWPDGESTSRPAQKPVVIDPVQVAEGKLLFEHEWQVHDKLAVTGDGLGPVFNGRSCVECHFQAGTGGSGTNAHNVNVFEILPDHEGGKMRPGVIHAFDTNGHLESPEQVRSLLGFPKVPLRRVASNTVTNSDAVISVFVNTPALWGNGVIDRITNDELFNLDKKQPLTGHLRRSPDGQIGKFGWKSQIPTLYQFVGSACAAELGLSNSVRPQHVPQSYQDDQSATKDMTDEQLTSLVTFVASLPAPRQILPTDKATLASVHEGNRLFTTVGCAACHVRDVGSASGIYSDFRLHLIETSIDASRSYCPTEVKPVYTPGGSVAQLGEWKTPPLWGVADTPPYWHDGSAVTLRDAILKHAEEGQYVADRFRSLGSDQQQHLLAFLGTLKAPDLFR